MSRKGSDDISQCYRGVSIIKTTSLAAGFLHSQEQVCQCTIFLSGVLDTAYKMAAQYFVLSQMMSDKQLSHPPCWELIHDPIGRSYVSSAVVSLVAVSFCPYPRKKIERKPHVNI